MLGYVLVPTSASSIVTGDILNAQPLVGPAATGLSVRGNPAAKIECTSAPTISTYFHRACHEYGSPIHERWIHLCVQRPDRSGRRVSYRVVSQTMWTNNNLGFYSAGVWRNCAPALLGSGIPTPTTSTSTSTNGTWATVSSDYLFNAGDTVGLSAATSVQPIVMGTPSEIYLNISLISC